MNIKGGTRNPLRNGPGGTGATKEAAPELLPIKNQEALHALYKEAKRLTTGLWSDGLTNFQRIAKSKQYRRAVALHGGTMSTNHIIEFLNVSPSAIAIKK